MPCFNAAPFIADSIRSVVSQDYPGPLELLVVDDGSSDDSVAIASRFDNVRVFSQTNQGPAAARNLALSHASGQLIGFLDADDQWLPGSLRARVECLEDHADSGVVFADFTRWTTASRHGQLDDEHTDQLPAAVEASADSGWLYPHILLDPIVHIITAVVRREVLDVIGGFDPALRTGEDYDLLIRLSRQCRFQRLRRVVARYRIHAGGTTRTPRPLNNEYEVAQRAISRYGIEGLRGERIDPRLLAKRLQRMCFDHAYSHFWRGDARIAFRGFARALRHDPSRAKAWLYVFLAAAKASLSITGVNRAST